MAMPGLLSDYIIKNYKRLLVCVVPPADVDEHTPSPTTPSDSSFVVPPSPRAHSLDTPTSSPRAPLESSVPRWRRRRSTTRVRARRSAGPYVYVHEGDQLVRGTSILVLSCLVYLFIFLCFFFCQTLI